MEIFKIVLFLGTCRATSETNYSTTSNPTNTYRTDAAYIETEYSDGNATTPNYADGNATTQNYADGSMLDVISNSNITNSIFYNLTTVPAMKNKHELEEPILGQL